MSVIYALHCANSNRVYIGQTRRSASLRLKQHLRDAILKRYPVHKWIYVSRNRGYTIELTILEKCSSYFELNEAESFYISYFSNIGMQLLNCTSGGGGIKNPSSETRQKMSTAATKRGAQPSEHYKKLSKLFKRRIFTNEWRAKISAAKTCNSPSDHIISLNKKRKGIPLSETHKRKLSLVHKGRYYPQLHNKGENHPKAKLNAKQVTEIRAQHDSAREIAKRFGVSKSTIYAIRSGQNWK